MELLDHRISALYEHFGSFAFSPTLDIVVIFNLVILVGVYFVKHLFKSFAYFSAELYVLLFVGVLFLYSGY